jgi:hypothetical protein
MPGSLFAIDSIAEADCRIYQYQHTHSSFCIVSALVLDCPGSAWFLLRDSVEARHRITPAWHHIFIILARVHARSMGSGHFQAIWGIETAASFWFYLGVNRSKSRLLLNSWILGAFVDATRCRK